MFELACSRADSVPGSGRDAGSARACSRPVWAADAARPGGIVSKTYRAALAPVLVLVLLAAACASVPPQRVALNSLQGVRASVVAAVQVFNAGYQQNQFSEAQRTALGTLYNKYVAADSLAATALGATTVGSDPNAILAQVTVVAADVIKFVAALKTPAAPAPVTTPVATPAPTAAPATRAKMSDTHKRLALAARAA